MGLSHRVITIATVWLAGWLSLSGCSGQAAPPPAPTAPPLQVESVSVPLSFAREPTTIGLTSMGGELKLRGQGDQLLQGVLTRSPVMPQPQLSATVGAVLLNQIVQANQGNALVGQTNVWDLQVSGTTPVQISLQAGRQNADIDLGHMRLRSFSLSEGDSTTKLNFSTPNQEDLRRVNINTGASKMEILNLMNARFASLLFEGGQGDYLFDFGGQAQRPAQVQIRSSTSQVVVRLPAALGAKLSVAKGPAATISGDFLTEGSGYITQGWRRNPTLEVTVVLDDGSVRFEAY